MISFIVQTRAVCSVKWSSRLDYIAQVSKNNCNYLGGAFKWITALDLCRVLWRISRLHSQSMLHSPFQNDSGALRPTGAPGIWYSTYDHNHNQILCNIKWYSRCWCRSAFLWHCCSMYFAHWYQNIADNPLNLTGCVQLCPIPLLVNGH